MKKGLFAGLATLATALSVVAVTNAYKETNMSKTYAGAEKTFSISGEELANYTPGSGLAPVSFGTCNDYAFRIDLGDGKYVNGLMLYGDCGGQTIHNLGYYTMNKTGTSRDYYNFNLVFGFKGITSVSLDADVYASAHYSKCNLVQCTYVAQGEIVDDCVDVPNYHSDTLPTDINRNHNNYYDLAYGKEEYLGDTPTKVSFNNRTGTDDWSVTKSVVYAFNSFIDGLNSDSDSTMLTVKINSITIKYSC